MRVQRYRATPLSGGRSVLLPLLLIALMAAGSLAKHHEHDKHDKMHHKGKDHGDHVAHHDDHHDDHHVAHHIADDHHGADHPDTEAHHEEEYDALEKRLNKATTRLENIEDGLDTRLDPEHKIKARSFAHRVHKLNGEEHCDKVHYDCGGDDHECTSRLKVCDGIKDCRNGDDEKHCDLPTNSGDTFVGKVVFDKCTQRHPDEVSFTITAVKKTPAYTATPLVRALIHIEKDSKESEAEVNLPTIGYYRFATQNLVLLPPEDDGLALICDFDGSNPDKCVGNIVYQTSLETCAQFIFFRKHDEEEKKD